MFCPKCGTSVDDEYKFCFKCGTRLPLLNGGNVVTTESVSVQDTKMPIKEAVIYDKHSINNCQRINKKFSSLWCFLWGSNESSVAKCIWMIVLGVVNSSVGYVLLDYSNMLDMRHGVKGYRLAEFLIGYIIHIIGMACVTRYVVILLAKVKYGEYEPHNYGKRIKAYLVCLIFFVGWIMGKSCIRSWLEIDKPSFSVWECIILCAVLKTAWRSIMGVNPKSGSKSASRKRLGYVLWTILLLGGLLLPLILSVVNSSDSRQDRVFHPVKRVPVREHIRKGVNEVNTGVKQKQLNTEKFLDHCRNERFANAAELIDKVDKNNVEVQFYLGKMYEKGLGVEKNLAKAYLLFRKAAKSGCTEAYTRLERERWDKQANSSNLLDCYYLFSDETLEKIALRGDKFKDIIKCVSVDEVEALIAVEYLKQIKKSDCSNEDRKSLQREFDKYKDALQRCIKNNEVSFPLSK